MIPRFDPVGLALDDTLGTDEGDWRADDGPTLGAIAAAIEIMEKIEQCRKAESSAAIG